MQLLKLHYLYIFFDFETSQPRPRPNSNLRFYDFRFLNVTQYM